MATRNEIAIGRALRQVYDAATERAIATGDAVVSGEQAKRLIAALRMAWARAARAATASTMRDVAAMEAKQDLWQQVAEEYARAYGGNAITAILEATRAQIMEMIRAGLNEGLTLPEIAKRIREAVPGLARRRAMVIARTETHSASVYASVRTAETQSRWPLEKEWVSVSDHRTRDFGEADGVVDQGNHRAMNGVKARMSEHFMVPNKFGGFDMMMYPGDRSAPAYQCVNCRCVLKFRRIGGFIA